MENFVTVDDVIELWRPLTQDEIKRTEALIEVVESSLEEEAYKVGKNIKEIAEERPSYKTVVKSVVVDIIARTLMTSTNSEPMKQESQSGLGYSWSGTYLVPGGGLFIKDNELKRLGLKNQKYGAIEIYDTWNNNNPYR